MDDAALGLRDRKRLQTRARLEQAAVELVLRNGLQHATVDAICEMVDVSPRTFFNYFESKEDAILGFDEVDVTATATSTATDVIEALCAHLVALAVPMLENRSLHAPRTEILLRYPELASKQLSRLTRITDDVLSAMHDFMARDSRFTYLAGATSPLAELILALCTASVRTAAKEWIAAGSDAPIDDIRIRAIALAREVVEKLQ